MGGHVIASFGVVAVDSFACLKWEFEKDKRLEISFFSLPAPFFFFRLSLSLPRALLAFLPCDNYFSG